MVHPNFKFWRAVGTLIGGMVGVGVFGLPYAFAQSGFALGALVFVIVGLLVGLLMLMYGEVVARSRGPLRLVGHVKNHLGARAGYLAGLTHTVSLWGALLAYIIVGGNFLHILCAPLLGGSPAVYSLILAAAAGAIVRRGLKFVSKLEVYIVSLLILVFVLIIVLGLKNTDPANLMTVNWRQVIVPYGVILFAFGGLGVVPEMADILGRRKHELARALFLGLILVAGLYALFALSVLGATGAATTPMALNGLIPVFGPGFGVISAFLGSLTILSIFSVLGIELMNLLKYDYRLKHNQAWLLTMFVPVFLFLLGLREFIELIGFIGSVFSAALGVIVVLLYEAMKKSAGSDYHGLNVPRPVCWLIIVIFILGGLLEIGSRL